MRPIITGEEPQSEHVGKIRDIMLSYEFDNLYLICTHINFNPNFYVLTHVNQDLLLQISCLVKNLATYKKLNTKNS